LEIILYIIWKNKGEYENIMKKTRLPKYPNKYLILGVIIFITGGLFLLWTLGFLPRFEVLWPLPVIIIGLFLLYMVIFHGRRDIYIIFGMVLSLGGIFILLVNTVISEKNLVKIWPAFMLITGISLIPYGIRKKKEKYRIAIIIPAVTIILLSCIFFLFSLDILGLTFQQFVSIWWPMLIMILGIAFIFIYSFSEKSKEKKDVSGGSSKENSR
jgi:peptidoglycan/LPS O-acetylase OafA/YrhL